MSELALRRILEPLPAEPRVVVSGNFATPWQLVGEIDRLLPAAIEAVRRTGGAVIAQANPRMPFTFGDGVIPVEEIDLMVEVDEPLGAHHPGPADVASVEIGLAVGARVSDGETLQAGIGAVPDAALAGLTDRRSLRVWTEMFSDSVLALERAGALDVTYRSRRRSSSAPRSSTPGYTATSASR